MECWQTSSSKLIECPCTISTDNWPGSVAMSLFHLVGILNEINEILPKNVVRMLGVHFLLPALVKRATNIFIISMISPIEPSKPWPHSDGSNPHRFIPKKEEMIELACTCNLSALHKISHKIHESHKNAKCSHRS